jgi:flavin-binding protein dodecin
LTDAPELAATDQPDGIEFFFTTPGHGETGGPAQAIVDAIDRAQASVDMAMYNLSMDQVGWVLVNAKNRGWRSEL